MLVTAASLLNKQEDQKKKAINNEQFESTI
jgi:hypothetical protein